MFFWKQRSKGGLSAQDAVAGAASGTVTVIDLREEGELARSGKAAGALIIPLSRLRQMADPAHPDFHRGLADAGRIALYCASGARSRMGVGVLRKMGYDDVHNIGGLGHWVKAGGPVEKP